MSDWWDTGCDDHRRIMAKLVCTVVSGQMIQGIITGFLLPLEALVKEARAESFVFGEEIFRFLMKRA